MTSAVVTLFCERGQQRHARGGFSWQVPRHTLYEADVGETLLKLKGIFKLPAGIAVRADGRLLSTDAVAQSAREVLAPSFHNSTPTRPRHTRGEGFFPRWHTSAS